MHHMQPMPMPVPHPASYANKGSSSNNGKRKEKRREISFLEYKPHEKKHFATATSANKVSNPSSRPRPSSHAKSRGGMGSNLKPATAAGPKLAQAPGNSNNGQFQPCPQVVLDYVASLHMLRANLSVQQVWNGAGVCRCLCAWVSEYGNGERDLAWGVCARFPLFLSRAIACSSIGSCAGLSPLALPGAALCGPLYSHS